MAVLDVSFMATSLKRTVPIKVIIPTDKRYFPGMKRREEGKPYKTLYLLVFTIVSFAWAGFGAAFGPVVLFALFWKRSNQWGALAGMVAGGGMVFLWKYLIRPLGGAWDLYELLPAFLVACVAIVAVSLLTPPPSAEICGNFEQVRHTK